VGCFACVPVFAAVCERVSHAYGQLFENRLYPTGTIHQESQQVQRVTTAVWKSMSKEEQQAAREQRREQGIPTRNVSTITTNQKKTTFDETVEGRHYNNDQPAASVAKNTTVHIATLEQLQPTQKLKVYKGQATAQTQMDPQAEIELLKQQLAELSKRI
jgi:hypothetical protein